MNQNTSHKMVRAEILLSLEDQLKASFFFLPICMRQIVGGMPHFESRPFGFNLVSHVKDVSRKLI